MYVVLMCGSRTWRNWEKIRDVLTRLEFEYGDDLVIIHGGHRQGADHIVSDLCHDMNITQVVYPANWGRFGRGAGPRRNLLMNDHGKPDLIYAFRAEGKSNGTDGMCQIGRDAGVEVRVEYGG